MSLLRRAHRMALGNICGLYFQGLHKLQKEDLDRWWGLDVEAFEISRNIIGGLLVFGKVSHEW